MGRSARRTAGVPGTRAHCLMAGGMNRRSDYGTMADRVKSAPQGGAFLDCAATPTFAGLPTATATGSRRCCSSGVGQRASGAVGSFTRYLGPRSVGRRRGVAAGRAARPVNVV